MLDLLRNILVHTPFWVALILLAILVAGLRQVRTHTVGTGRLRALPLVFGAVSLYSAWTLFSPAIGPQAIALWVLGHIAGQLLFRQLAAGPAARRLGPSQFEVAGGWLPLGLYLAIFLGRYVLAVTLAIQPALAQRHEAAWLICAALALPVGMLRARARRIQAEALPLVDDAGASASAATATA